MKGDQLLLCREQHLWLSPNRSIFWEEEKTMILSDTHFGKTGHFRKNGIAVPQNIYKEDLQRFFSITQFYKAQRVLVVGDFFHSYANEELDWFLKWKRDFTQLQITLVRGNHDVLPAEWYKAAAIEIVPEIFLLGPFQFQHNYEEKPEKNKDNKVYQPDSDQSAYIFSGHLHPGVTIKGLSKQSLRFPCFYFGKKNCILPAFSKFSGLATIKPKKSDQVFAIVNDNLIQTQ